ncbi:MAG TPA: deoxynucleoside kinase [Gemmatimonadota bacterium]|nr:deoxynucleoside kinase [Gemmatimonadota bacterium]
MTDGSRTFCAVAGNIGSGKSTLTSLLAERFAWRPYYEHVDGNPYLADFYSDMQRWAFHLQVYFLSKRFQHHQEILASPESVIQDRTIYEDAEIFARNLYENGHIDERDHANYRELFDTMIQFLAPPDLLIYLRTSVPILAERIRSRGREYEQAIPVEYLAQLHRHYEDWIARYDLSPVLVVETDACNLVLEEAELIAVADRVQRRLEATRGYSLPL